MSNAELSSTAPAPFHGWRLLAALWVILFINLAFPMYGLSVLDPYMATALHLDRTLLGLTYAVYMSMTGIPAPLAAWLVQRFGIRATLLAGNLLLAVGAALMATVITSPWAIVLVAGAVVGTSDAIGGPVPAQASVTRWFVKRRSFALAVLLTGGGIGGFVAAPLLDRLVAHVRIGWRAGWWVVAALGMLACVISWLAVQETPEAVGQWPDGQHPESQQPGGKREPLGGASRSQRERPRVHITSEDWSPLEALRSPTLWLLMAAALGFSAALTLFLAQGITHLEDLGHSAEMAAFALSFSVLFGLAASLAVGALGDRIDPRWLWAWCSGLDAIGMIALLAARSDALMFAAAAALGAAGSGAMVCLVTLLANYYGPRAYPAVFAAASAIQSTLGAVAPVVAGYWYDRHGSYEPVFLAVAALCAAGAVALALIAPPTRRLT
ncbi:MAG: MFS transporter [Steroidobacteraceae bacterium]